VRLESDQRVGVYEIVSSLGAGGMGEVYRARDTRLGRLVAIKFVSAELAANRTAAGRLEREARLTSLLNHPNIVTVHDVGGLDGRPFIVMERLRDVERPARLQARHCRADDGGDRRRRAGAAGPTVSRGEIRGTHSCGNSRVRGGLP
jgi:hypothetical protein